MTDMQEHNGCKFERALHVEYYRSDKMHAKTCTTQVKLTTYVYAKSVSSAHKLLTLLGLCGGIGKAIGCTFMEARNNIL